MVLPSTSPPRARTILPAIAFLRAALTSTVASTSRIGLCASAAVRTSAKVSLGKHEPP